MSEQALHDVTKNHSPLKWSSILHGKGMGILCVSRHFYVLCDLSIWAQSWVHLLWHIRQERVSYSPSLLCIYMDAGVTFTPLLLLCAPTIDGTFAATARKVRGSPEMWSAFGYKDDEANWSHCQFICLGEGGQCSAMASTYNAQGASCCVAPKRCLGPSSLCAHCGCTAWGQLLKEKCFHSCVGTHDTDSSQAVNNALYCYTLQVEYLSHY